MIKYPRTQHVHGSRLQNGDHDLEQVSLNDLFGKNLIIEQKLDGANTGISFDSDGKLYLQSRGHYLTGGPREEQFDLFKQWANTYAEDLYFCLQDRYVAYGEWLYKKHTIYYDLLPHYWIEFDIYDKQTKTFLSTPKRHEIFSCLNSYVSAPIVFEGIFTKDTRLDSLISRNQYRSSYWKSTIKESTNVKDYDIIFRTTDPSTYHEGVYIKWEDDGKVKGRYKYVRNDFASMITHNDTHHINLPFTSNKLNETNCMWI